MLPLFLAGRLTSSFIARKIQWKQSSSSKYIRNKKPKKMPIHIHHVYARNNDTLEISYLLVMLDRESPVVKSNSWYKENLSRNCRHFYQHQWLITYRLSLELSHSKRLHWSIEWNIALDICSCATTLNYYPEIVKRNLTILHKVTNGH